MTEAAWSELPALTRTRKGHYFGASVRETN